MSGVDLFSQGLSDAFVGKLTIGGQIEFLRSGGGVGTDEVSFLGIGAKRQLDFGWCFFRAISMG